MPSFRKPLIAILSTCAAAGVGMGLTLPLLSLTLERIGVPGSVNGLNLATGGLAALLITPRVPDLMRRFGAAPFLAGSLALAAVALIAIYHAPDLWLWFPIRFVLSAALNGLFVVSEFWINQLATERTRGKMVAFYAMCLSGGFAAGPMMLLVLGTRGEAPFLVGAAMLVVAAVPAWAARASAPRIAEGKSVSPFATIAQAPAALAAAFVFGALDAGMAGLFPVYAVRSGYSEQMAALTVAALSVGGIVFQYPLGWLADRMERNRLLMLCASAGFIGAVAIPFGVASPALLYALLFVWGGIVMGIYTIGLTLLGQRFHGPQLASANAAYVILYSLGLLLGPAAEGIALDAWNPTGLLASLAAIAAVYVGFLLFRRPPRSQTA